MQICLMQNKDDYEYENSFSIFIHNPLFAIIIVLFFSVNLCNFVFRSLKCESFDMEKLKLDEFSRNDG